MGVFSHVGWIFRKIGLVVACYRFWPIAQARTIEPGANSGHAPPDSNWSAEPGPNAFSNWDSNSGAAAASNNHIAHANGGSIAGPNGNGNGNTPVILPDASPDHFEPPELIAEGSGRECDNSAGGEAVQRDLMAAHAEALQEVSPQLAADASPASLRGFSLITYNVKMLLGDASPSRARAIARELLKRNPTFIFMQELFDNRCKNAILSVLKHKYPYAVIRAGRKRRAGLGEDSGLAMFSQLPLRNVQFEAFRVATKRTADSWARKGVLLAETVIYGQTLLLVTTHLQADYDPAHRNVQVRSAQWGQILNLLKERWHTVDHALFGGDFNVDFASEEWVTLMDDFPGQALTVGAATTPEGEDIDHVLDVKKSLSLAHCQIDPMFRTSPTDVACDADGHLSDHFAVHVLLHLHSRSRPRITVTTAEAMQKQALAVKPRAKRRAVRAALTRWFTFNRKMPQKPEDMEQQRPELLDLGGFESLMLELPAVAREDLHSAPNVNAAAAPPMHLPIQITA